MPPFAHMIWAPRVVSLKVNTRWLPLYRATCPPDTRAVKPVEEFRFAADENWPLLLWPVVMFVLAMVMVSRLAKLLVRPMRMVVGRWGWVVAWVGVGEDRRVVTRTVRSNRCFANLVGMRLFMVASDIWVCVGDCVG